MSALRRWLHRKFWASRCADVMCPDHGDSDYNWIEEDAEL